MINANANGPVFAHNAEISGGASSVNQPVKYTANHSLHYIEVQPAIHRVIMVTSNSVEVNGAAPELVELVHRASTSKEVITLTDKGKTSAVLLSLETFEHLVGLQQQHAMISQDEFQRQIQKDFADSGYDSREKIIELVREVKREMYEERHQQP